MAELVPTSNAGTVNSLNTDESSNTKQTKISCGALSEPQLDTGSKQQPVVAKQINENYQLHILQPSVDVELTQ